MMDIEEYFSDRMRLTTGYQEGSKRECHSNFFRYFRCPLESCTYYHCGSFLTLMKNVQMSYIQAYTHNYPDFLQYIGKSFVLFDRLSKEANTVISLNTWGPLQGTCKEARRLGSPDQVHASTLHNALLLSLLFFCFITAKLLEFKHLIVQSCSYFGIVFYG